MPKELRLCTSTRIHPKIRRLRNKLGPEGVLALYNLWCFCIEYKQDGRLVGMEDVDVAEAADYDGCYEGFVHTLVELRLLDATEGVFTVHNWSRYNKSKKTETARNPAVKVTKLSETIRSIVGYYRTVHPTRGKMLKPGSRDWKRIRARLVEDEFTKDDLLKAIDGNKICPWHSKHPAGYSAEYVFRNGTKVEGFIELATNGARKEEQIGHHKGSEEFKDGDQSSRF
tara:strand:- start:473 stop:1153 length:681 start_codon:yes stop_codon:yes gene_type:complete